MSIAKEFKEFAAKGSVIDLAVGVIIGAAFGKIVTSLVDDVIMPPIGMVLNGVDFSKLSITLRDAIGDKPAVLIRYGVFINTLITFLIVAFCIFLMVKAINKMNRKKEAAPPPPAPPTKEEVLLTEIRDELRKR
ncbi:MAG: large-conductance mechanosensitive channel protein MscL [Bacteroidota bacterium]|nr:large-conductance mechanosensitive channel protein MscL [Bacteroidota bacterium]MDP4229189.1 large-conductance mechanosensitive channel protein MscL [Bacteroidota bacterium]MDP4236709.1 large-conductance mechanosensitive channel protein MscL [Bacteroidota bacterium]